jgi:hypothetical protein
MYSLGHSSIVRRLLAGVPIRVVVLTRPGGAAGDRP